MYEKQSRNTNRSTDTIASFLLKTYEILQHPQYQRMISWDKSNVGFIIHEVLSFTRQILPKYFRHSNFSSFVRQLNMYDFHKVKQQNDSLVFKNPLFCKGQQHNLKFIRRKAAKKIGGQRRQHINQKNDLQNQKYQNLLKGFKKSIQAQINQSSLFYERSIQLIKDQNQSNKKKLNYIQKLYVNDQKGETTQQIPGKNIHHQQSLTKNTSIQSIDLKKDTLIRIPRQFVQHQSDNKKDVKKDFQTISKVDRQDVLQKKSINLDHIVILKQQIYKSLGTFQHWLNDYIQIQKKKIKYVSSYKNQLIKCKQNDKQNEQNYKNSQNNNGYEDFKNIESQNYDIKQQENRPYNDNAASDSNEQNYISKSLQNQNLSSKKNDNKIIQTQNQYKVHDQCNQNKRFNSFISTQKLPSLFVNSQNQNSIDINQPFIVTKFKNFQIPQQQLIKNKINNYDIQASNQSIKLYSHSLINPIMSKSFTLVSPKGKKVQQQIEPLKEEQKSEFMVNSQKEYQNISDLQPNWKHQT